MGHRTWASADGDQDLELWHGGNSASQIIDSLNQSLLHGGDRFDECTEAMEPVLVQTGQLTF